jgi:hypothetical protein
VAVTLAMPDALVTAVALESVAVAPVAGAANVTVTPLTAVPAAFFTVTCSATGKTVATAADCGVPPVAEMLAGEPDVFVSEKEVEKLPVVAVTIKLPAVALAVAVTLARPEALVTAVVLDNVALAPLAGAANVTVAPDTGVPAASFTRACKALPNAVPTAVDCGVPPTAEMRADAFVNENATESDLTLAVTV